MNYTRRQDAPVSRREATNVRSGNDKLKRDAKEKKLSKPKAPPKPVKKEERSRNKSY
jgi:hypothetical protein